MNKFIKGALAAGALAMAAPAFAQEIVVVSHGQANDAFWNVVKNGVEQAGKDAGVNVEYRAPETFDMVAMSQLIDAAVNQEPDGLIVSIPDADALGPSGHLAAARPQGEQPHAGAGLATAPSRDADAAQAEAQTAHTGAQRRERQDALAE